MEQPRLDGPSLSEAPLGSRPIAMVLSGGGAYGSWQAGALYGLSKSLVFHSILGTSMGCVNGAAYFQGNVEMMKEIWRNMERHRFLRFAPRLSPPSFLSSEAVRNFLASIIDEDQCRKTPRCWLYVIAADILNNEICQATYSPEPNGIWDSPLIEHILGSIAIPLVFPPVQVQRSGEEGPRRLLVDGHLISFTMLKPLVDRGARDFIFLSVAGPEREGPPGFRFDAYLHTLIHQVLRAQVHNSLEAVYHIAPAFGLRFFEFNPLRHLSMSVLGFDAKQCRDGFDLGLEDTEVFLKRPEEFRLI